MIPPFPDNDTPRTCVNMSVVGIDLGTLNSVIAVARNRGVDVVSTGLSPRVVGFRSTKHHTDRQLDRKRSLQPRNTVSALTALTTTSSHNALTNSPAGRWLASVPRADTSARPQRTRKSPTSRTPSHRSSASPAAPSTIPMSRSSKILSRRRLSTSTARSALKSPTLARRNSLLPLRSQPCT